MPFDETLLEEMPSSSFDETLLEPYTDPEEASPSRLNAGMAGGLSALGRLPGQAWRFINKQLGTSVNPQTLHNAFEVFNTLQTQAEATQESGESSPQFEEGVQAALETPNTQPSQAEKIAAGLQTVAAENLTSPLALALPMASKLLPTPLQRMISLGFGTHMAINTPEAAREAGKASVEGDTYEKVRAYGNLGLTAAMAPPMLVHGVPRPGEIKGLFKRPVADETPRVEGELGEPVPEFIEQTVGPDGKPIEVLEINKQKKTALVRPLDKPESPPEVISLADITTQSAPKRGQGPARPVPEKIEEILPLLTRKARNRILDILEKNSNRTLLYETERLTLELVDAASKKIQRGERITGEEIDALNAFAKPLTIGEQNAIENAEATTVYGDVRSQSGESKGEVPLNEGSTGVQSSGKPAESKTGEISLEPEVKSLLDAAGEVNKKAGLKGDVELVEEPAPAGTNEAADIAFWENGKIKVNVPEFRKWLSRIPEADRAKAVESLLNEEGIHGKVQEVLGDSLMEQLWQGLTAAEQKLIRRSYLGPEWRRAEGVSDAQFGHEYMRRLMQWAMRTNPREVAAAKGLEWMKQKGIDLALKGIDKVRRTFPKETGNTLNWMLDRMEQNLEAAQKVVSGERLSSKAEVESPEETSKRVAAMTPAEFMAWSKTLPQGGVTKVAMDMAAEATSQEFVNSLKEQSAEIGRRIEQNKKARTEAKTMEEKLPLMEEGLSLGVQQQFFNEAYGAATGTGSAGELAIAKGDGPKFKAAAKNPLQAVEQKRKAFGALFKAGSNRKVMDQTIDAADNKAAIAGQQMGNRLKLGSTPIEREAAMAVVEANGDRTKLADFLAKATAGNNEKAIAAVNYAQANWDRLQPLAARTKSILDAQSAREQNAGLNTEYREGYIPHIYEMDLLMGSGRPYIIAGGGGGLSTGFKKGRTFDTVFDAIEEGYTPKSMDVSDLVEHRVKLGERLINRKGWTEALRNVVDPSNNKPIVADIEKRPRGNGQFYEVAPMGYTPREIVPGVRIAVHEGYAPLFDALTGNSRISGTLPGKLLMETAGGIKHGLLVFDSFHASRIFQKLLFLAPGKVLSRKAGYERGKSLLEYSDADLGAAVRERLITPEIEQWVRANRANANLLIKNGLNVGRIQESLYTGIVRKIPGLGTFNKWVFEKLTRGALMEAGLIELERIRKAKPNVPVEDIARDVARDLNAYFGNLGRQGIFKSATAQDLARLVALAPQWVESMARTEIKGAAQAVKGVTYDPIVHKSILIGSIGKGVAQGLAAYFVATQILNLATRKKPTWENEEEGHKLDAWIPDLTGKSNGFFISPFSVVAELTHDMLRYAHKESSKLDAAVRIANNKASPLFRAAKVLLSGRDYDGKQINDTWKRVKAAAWAVAPTPIPLAPVIKGGSYPGQMQRQLTASAGFKTEPAESATQQIVSKAKRFIEEAGKKRPVTLEASDEPSYAKLRDLLRKDDMDGAKQMLKDILKTHKPRQVLIAMRNHVKRPFTGSRIEEQRFMRGLSKPEFEMYRRARDEQRKEYEKFQDLWAKK